MARSRRLARTCVVLGVLGVLVAALRGPVTSATRGEATAGDPGRAALGAPAACMPKPSTCGFPDPSTTGVTPGTRLIPIDSDVTLNKAGAVYENKLVHGSITVTAPNVTIRNVRLVTHDPNYGIRAFSGENDVSGLSLDHVEIDLNGNYNAKGIAFDDYTARNVYFHDGSDCAHMGHNVTIEDSYCALGPDANDDGLPDSTAFCDGSEHFDGFQSDGGGNLTIRHNTIRNPCSQTSAILMSTNTAPIDRVTIDDNLLAGGGYTVYCGTDDGGVATNTAFTNNVIAKTYFARGGRWGSETWCDKVGDSHGNVWDGDARISLAQTGRLARRALAQRLRRDYAKRSRAVRSACRRRSSTLASCRLRWRLRRGAVIVDSYAATVAIRRTSARRYRYTMTVRHWSRACRCARVVRYHGTVFS